MEYVNWNPFHGCTKISAGCKHCYVFTIDKISGKNTNILTQNLSFYQPIEKNLKGQYKFNPKDKIVFICSGSDFFHFDADQWRSELWEIIKLRSDIKFMIVTKRIDRVLEPNFLPSDWGRGYNNVEIRVTTENQNRADYRIPILLDLPAKFKSLICEPLLEELDLRKFLSLNQIYSVYVGGEANPKARPCNYKWVKSIADQCSEFNVGFRLYGTGSYWVNENGDTEYIAKSKDQYERAKAYKNFNL